MAVFPVSTVAFGLLTYMIVGGTRAISSSHSLSSCLLALFAAGFRVDAGGGGRAGDCWHVLAGAKRYGMNVSGDEAFYTFLYLTPTPSRRGRIWRCCCRTTTTSLPGPGSNCPRFLCLYPFLAVPGRPSMVLNSANYFTWEVLITTPDWRSRLRL